MLHKTLCLLLVFASPLFAQQISVPAGGVELSDFSKSNAYVTPVMGSARRVGDHWAVTIVSEDREKPYNAQLTCPLTGDGCAKDDVLLLIVKARSTGPASGNLRAKIQLSKAPYTALVQEVAFEVGTAWTEYPVLFRSMEELPDGAGAVALTIGHVSQQLEISAVSLFRYPKGADTSAFPKIHHTYPGREADAPWRKLALDRIEKIRKKDLTLTLLGADGQPLANRRVKLTQTRSEFGFGSAVPAAMLSDSTPDAEHFRRIVERNFSMVTFENDLKDMFWGSDRTPEQKAELKKQLDAAFVWLDQRGIKARGHYLMQVAKPPNLAEMSEPDVIRNHFITTTNERLTFVGNRVTEWDVVNHPVAWDGADLLSRIPALGTLDREIFTLARKSTSLPFYVNEDQIFRPGHQSDGTHAYLAALKRDGFAIAGLGNQAHFDASFLPPMEKIWETTDHFASIVPHQIITEYDVNTGDDEALAADYTRDLLIACYSHPAYRGFIFWGFWEGSHWIKDCASWNQDWSIRARGKVIEEWIGQRWRSRLEATTDARGEIRWRGFPGRYQMEGDAGQATFEATSISPAPVVYAR